MSEKAWPLDVYRHSVARGWEKQVPAHLQDTQHHLQANAKGIPRVGCIVVKRYRLKIPLAMTRNIGGNNTGGENSVSQSSSQDNSLDSSSAAKAASEEVAMEVVRRYDSLLLTPRSRGRCICLKFPSVRECIEFSDELMRLNRSLRARPMAASGPAAVAPAGSIAPGVTEKTMKELLQENTGPSEEQAVVHADPMAIELQKNDMKSYIARLLHDKSFLQFAQKLCGFTEADPDIAQMIQACPVSEGEGGE